MPQLRIWTNYDPLSPDAAKLRTALPGHSVTFGNIKGPDPRLSEADVALGQPDPQQVMDLKNLRWVQVSSAGYTKYDRDDFRAAMRSRGAIFTNSSSVHFDPCAQHALSMMLALARQLPQSVENQLGQRGWPAGPLRAKTQLLNGQSALLIGYGSIGKRLAELLAPFRMELIGVRRKIQGDESIRMITIDQLDSKLGWADHIVNLLPSSSSTTQLFTADRFKKMKKSAIFYNIGRGDTVDQIAMRTALETNSIAAAYLDVMTPEPLPPHDPLWTTPNCFITPHTAGGIADEVDRIIGHFVQNLKRFEKGEAMSDRLV